MRPKIENIHRSRRRRRRRNKNTKPPGPGRVFPKPTTFPRVIYL